MIELRNINFRYAGGTDAGGLVNIDLIIPDGQVILLCGQSGCGKTTLTRLVNGLIPNYYEGELSGEVLLDGKNISGLPLYETAKYVGSVFQNPRTQFFTVDSTSELAFGCENQGLPEEEIIQRVKSTAEQFDMDNLLGKNIFSLSGGEKQKIACASVSASNPPIIVLDEPSSNLDMSATKDLRRMIQIWKQQGSLNKIRTLLQFTIAEKAASSGKSAMALIFILRPAILCWTVLPRKTTIAAFP